MFRSVVSRAGLRVLAFALLAVSSMSHAVADDRVELAGHVLAGLPAPAKNAGDASTPLALTIVLARSDEAGFEAWLADVYDPASPQFRQFLAPVDVSDRFGPSASDYAAVKRYFGDAGFAIAEESPNRLTLTLTGTRDAAKRALAVDIADFERGARAFYANTNAPVLPPGIATKVRAVAGLSNLGTPQRKSIAIDGPEAVAGNIDAIRYSFCTVYVGLKNIAADFENIGPWFQNLWVVYAQALQIPAVPVPFKDKYKCNPDGTAVVDNSSGGQNSGGTLRPDDDEAPAATNWTTIDGTGQRIGLVEFDRFNQIGRAHV